ncbi:MAG: hypothetical protein LBS50_06215 [Prevotellaceae bacterium]|jgi:hypothetical protein|nr:hypothetical protein [Prevotellaceae bacterium]
MKNSRSFNFPTASILMLTLALAMSGNARAQVTIGANLEPQSFSVLELISLNSKGLRLPQMDSVQRNAMMETQAFKDEKKGKARGLQIFNTSTYCVETWNGTKWIEECMDCSDVAAPVIISPFSACLVGGSVTFIASPVGDYKWQTSDDNGITWTDVAGTGSSNSIVFTSVNNYLVRASAHGCINKVSNMLPIQVLASIVTMGDLYIMTLNNVMYSYQFAKLATYVSSGTVLGYQWYMKYEGYAEQGAALSTKPAKDEADDIIVGANQSTYTFDPYSDAKYQGAGSYYFYCKAFGKNGGVDKISLDSILIRVEDLYDASLSVTSPRLITKEQWQIDSVNPNTSDGHVYFIPVLHGSGSASPNLKIAHASLGATKTRDAGELGNLFQWGRDEDGHERRQYEGRYSNWASLLDTATFVSPRLNTQVSTPQATGNAVGKFLYGTSFRNWTTIDFTSGWGIGTDSTHTTDPCKKRNTSWHLPNRNNDVVKLTLGSLSSANWTNNQISGQSNQKTVLYRYPWGSRYGTESHGSITIVSTSTFDTGKYYVAILPATGSREYSSGNLTNYIGSGGFFWSCSFSSSPNAYNFAFNKDFANPNNSNPRGLGFCVRCVTEN